MLEILLEWMKMFMTTWTKCSQHKGQIAKAQTGEIFNAFPQKASQRQYYYLWLTHTVQIC